MDCLQRGACVAVLCCVTLLGLCDSCRERFPTTCADRTTFRILDTDLQSRPYTLQCPRRAKITEVKAVAVKNACRGSTTMLEAFASDCIWNWNCTFPLIPRINDIITSTVTEDATCLGQYPTSFQIAYICLKRNADVKDVLGNFQRTTQRVGVARSHNLFPWSYRNGQGLGNLTIVRPRTPTNLRTLWFTVQTLSLLDTDLLFLSWVGNSDADDYVDELRPIRQEDGTFSLEGVQQVNLTLYAYYDAYDRRGAEGFVLCYQWLPDGSRPTNNSTCSEVMKPVQCPPRKRSRGGTMQPQNHESQQEQPVDGWLAGGSKRRH